MQLINIKESGTNNTLLWAISNGVNVKEDLPLTSIVNDELFYLVTLKDVNFFELFRLTQMYREKLRIINEKQADMPSREELLLLFPGGHQLNPDDPEEKSMSLSFAAEHVIENFINIASQMATDDDIIHSNAIRMFLPMITRKFDVQIPVSFIDFIDSMDESESNKVFTSDYPNTIQEILDSETHGVKNTIMLGFVKGVSIIKYDKRYDKYLNIIKYSPLKHCTAPRLYKFGLVGFSKRDNISRGEVRCNLFQSKKETISHILRRLGNLNTPLELDFAIQLPIQYMQILENSFSRDVLTISYESSMNTIIAEGLIYEDFKTSEYVNPEKEEDLKELEMHNNSIEAYRVRISEANQAMLNVIPILLQSPSCVDTTSIFSLLPSIYMAKAVITINMDLMPKFINHEDPLLAEMFQDIMNMSISIVEDIRRSK